MSKFFRSSIKASTFAIAFAISACGGAGEARNGSGQAGNGSGDGGRGGVAASGEFAALIEAGGTCTAARDCKSGFCADGVCCRSDCSGLCQSCAVEGSVGTCTNVPVGADPHNECPDDGGASCGRDGTCDGAGACALYAAGTICQASSCNGSTVSHAARCDGAGACGTVSSDSCGPYMCDGGGRSCRSDCTTNADCVGGAVCTNGSCGPKPPGAACAVAADCASGFCVEGVCCATACGGACRSCAVSGSEGRCIDVPAGTDPLNQCADQGASSCGTDGACDGSGACRKYASGTVCGGASCSAGTSMPARTCNGGGTCLIVVPAPCGAYTCASSGDSCRTTCATTADCASGNVCTMGACVPPPDPSGAGGGGGGGGATGTGGGAAGTGGGSAGSGGASGTAGGGGTSGSAGSGGAGGGGRGGSGGNCPGVFCDDFEDGDASGWTPIGGTWSVIGDGSSVYRGANGSGNAIAGSASWTDQTVEARVKVVQFGNTKPGFRAGVIARYANTTSFYVFLYDGKGSLQLLKDGDLPPSHAGACAKIDANLTAGSWHTLKLSVSGSTNVRLQTFLDGTPVHDCTTSAETVPAGAIGAYVYGSNTIVEFDDVRVSTP